MFYWLMLYEQIKLNENADAPPPLQLMPMISGEPNTTLIKHGAKRKKQDRAQQPNVQLTFRVVGVMTIPSSGNLTSPAPLAKFMS